MMLDVTYKGNIAVLDVRERIQRGEHPRQEILQFVKEAKHGTVIEIHLPIYPKPLIDALELIGIQSIINSLGPNHFRMMCVKI
ncbi:amino acid decarboxylase [Brevibacillus sp. SYSU BS000544]|uniref:amino acid decarboxylase n=1 Tax=Brevibacillus sp. SYSU BS000544 TaxID=3416443 RepID=UPI003CE53D3D